MTLVDDTTGMEVAQGTRRTTGGRWAVREGYLEAVVVYAQTCQSE